MNHHSMEYNSSTEKLTLPEYGRNIQKLVKHAKEIEDLEVRQLFVEKIVNLMMQMTPYNRNMEDQRDKLWRHVFQIAGYELEGVTPPNGIPPTPDNTVLKPQNIPYPKSKARFRHYGNNVQTLVEKAIALEEGPVREGFIRAIASYMKVAYKTWNKEHFVSDEVVKTDLMNLSNGALSIPDNEPLAPVNGGSFQRSQRKNNGSKSSSNKKGRRKK